jgi:hypothetical protein
MQIASAVIADHPPWSTWKKKSFKTPQTRVGLGKIPTSIPLVIQLGHGKKSS